MGNVDLREVEEQLNSAMLELLEVADLQPKDIFVVGCSTSEIQGHHIGKFTSDEVGKVVFDTINSKLVERDIFLAVQGCEHINRSLVVEAECARIYNLNPVNVIPQLDAGGGLSVAAYENFINPVMVEYISAQAGLDIGDTFIGMHLDPVVVPVRGEIKTIGEANLNLARVRTKLIGGARAKHF